MNQNSNTGSSFLKQVVARLLLLLLLSPVASIASTSSVQATDMDRLVSQILVSLQQYVPDHQYRIYIDTPREQNHPNQGTEFGYYLQNKLQHRWRETFRNHRVVFNSNSRREIDLRLIGRYLQHAEGYIAVEMKLEKWDGKSIVGTTTVPLAQWGWGRYDPFRYSEDETTFQQAAQNKLTSASLSVDLFAEYIAPNGKSVRSDENLAFPICALEDRRSCKRVKFLARASKPAWIYAVGYYEDQGQMVNYMLELNDRAPNCQGDCLFIGEINKPGEELNIGDFTIQSPAGLSGIQMIAIPKAATSVELPAISSKRNRYGVYELEGCWGLRACIKKSRGPALCYDEEMEPAEDILKYASFCSDDDWSCKK
jgi:hypothetical protein